MKIMVNYSWPGNVRELRNVVEYAFAVGRGAELLREELPPELQEVADAQPAMRMPMTDTDDTARAR